MPVPPIPPVGSFGSYTCGAGTQQTTAQPLMGGDVLYALATTDPVTLQEIRDILGLGGGITGGEVVEALAGEPPSELGGIAGALLTAMFNNGGFSTDVQELPSGSPPSLEVTPSKTGGVLITLGLAEEIMSQIQATDSITVPVCGGQVQQGQLITYPSAVTNTGVTMHAVYQQIINMLSQLLRCCDPCPPVSLNNLIAVGGSGHLEFPTPLIRLEVSFKSASDVSKITFGNPDLFYYGNIRWEQADGSFGEPIFLNSKEQAIFPNVPYPIGFAWMLLYDSTAIISVIEQEQWTGIGFP